MRMLRWLSLSFFVVILAFAGQAGQQDEKARQDPLTKTVLQNFEAGHKMNGCPVGAVVNDHKWTKLGLGNTVALSTGHLTVDGHKLDKLPSWARCGLFAEGGQYPAIMRFSDFGPETGSLTDFVRMAVKIPIDASSGREMNFTTTETIDIFTEPDHQAVEAMVTGRRWWSQCPALAAARFRQAGALLRDPRGRDGHAFAKTYYSQLPYALEAGGMEGGAFKYRFRALQQPDPVGKRVEDMRGSVKDYLSESTAQFELEIQLHPDLRSDLVQKQATTRWPAEWIPVGTLVFPKQDTDDMGCSLELKRRLEGHLLPQCTEEEQKQWASWWHKAFRFHPSREEQHPPVGEVNSFRAAVYPAQAHERAKLLSDSTDPIRSHAVPWKQLLADEASSPMFFSSTCRNN